MREKSIAWVNMDDPRIVWWIRCHYNGTFSSWWELKTLNSVIQKILSELRSRLLYLALKPVCFSFKTKLLKIPFNINHIVYIYNLNEYNISDTLFSAVFNGSLPTSLNPQPQISSNKAISFLKIFQKEIVFNEGQSIFWIFNSAPKECFAYLLRLWKRWLRIDVVMKDISLRWYKYHFGWNTKRLREKKTTRERLCDSQD